MGLGGGVPVATDGARCWSSAPDPFHNLSKQQCGQGKYVPLFNHLGILIAHLICLKLADDFYWLSIAGSKIAKELAELPPENRTVTEAMI